MPFHPGFQKGMLVFDAAQFDGILKKILEFNSALLSKPVGFPPLLLRGSFFLVLDCVYQFFFEPSCVVMLFLLCNSMVRGEGTGQIGSTIS